MSVTLVERLDCLYRADAALVDSGRLVTTRFLIQSGDEAAVVGVVAGQVESIVDATRLVTPNWTFALRSTQPEWDGFWAADPRPGWHDLFALLRRKTLRLEGQLHPFMSHLFYFKALLALPREAR